MLTETKLSIISAELLNDMREVAWSLMSSSSPYTKWMLQLEACPGPKQLMVRDDWVASELQRP